MFADRFWSANYSDGFEALFGKLNQGCVENSQLLALASARAEAEESYGQQLLELPRAIPDQKKGFGRDDGATIKRSFEGIAEEMAKEGYKHLQVADTIRTMVVDPFAKWSSAHQQRIEYSQVDLRKKIKQFQRELIEVERSQKRYFNRCRVEEDASATEAANSSSANAAANSSGSSESLAPTPGPNDDTQKESAANTSAANISSAESTNSGVTSGPTSEELVLAGTHYSSDDAQRLVAQMLREIPQEAVRVAILGTYENCSKGSDIVKWIETNTELKTVHEAEEAGQDLVSSGLLRLIGQVGSRFANSSVMKYQWRPKAWAFAGLRHDGSAFTGMVTDLTSELSERWAGTAFRSGGLSSGIDDNANGAITVKELDQKYRKNVSILDNVRCELEESAVEHLNFLERCERDRLAAIKAVMLDLCAAVSNVVPSIQASVDKLLLYQETADPKRDLRFLVETYQTGAFQPRVAVYDNYYSSADGSSVFGTDIELRSRGDRKPVPFVVSSLLSYLDRQYPTMENDEERLAAWCNSEKYTNQLAAAHQLRREMNHFSSPEEFRQLLTKIKPAPSLIVATLHLYFLELPDSLLPAQYYEVLKGVYYNYSGSSDEDKKARITAVQNSLAQLRVSHIATLDAFTAHVKRLVTIANAQPKDITGLCKRWGSAICRPRLPSSIALGDNHPPIVLEDLLRERDQVFKELKRQAQSTGPSRLPSVVASSTRAASYLNSGSIGSRSRSSTLSKSRPESRSSSGTRVAVPSTPVIPGATSEPASAETDDSDRAHNSFSDAPETL